MEDISRFMMMVDDMTGSHASDELLERYAMSKLLEPEAAGLEEHLLVCSECRDRLEETETFLAAFRQVAQEPQPARRSLPNRILANLLLRQVPRLAWVPAAAAIALLAVWIPMQREGGGSAKSVELMAYRSSDGSRSAAIRSGERVEFRADLTGLPAAEAYRLEIVDLEGTVVYRSEAKPEATKLVISINDRLEAGRYWVRIYQLDQAETPLREFGIQVE